ncbi:MAG: DNA adenine methyltransferase YhdJ [Nitrospira sp.]|nr:DNA adenine methyltransferase YhdJ [Nitrospira sp.]
MAECPVEQFDVILTDPPYGMGADEFGDSGGLAAGAHGYKDDAENFLRIMEELPYLTFRVAKPLAHLYVFCDIGWHQLMREKFAEAGWWVFRTPMIWYKKSGMRAPWPESGPQRKYETLLYAVKGKRSVKHMLGDVLDYSPDTNLGHAAQKPVALFSDLLRRSVNPGDSVLDPFAGSGTIFPAAHEHKCRATGIEMDTASYGIGLKRLEQLKALKELGI